MEATQHDHSFVVDLYISTVYVFINNTRFGSNDQHGSRHHRNFTYNPLRPFLHSVIESGDGTARTGHIPGGHKSPVLCMILWESLRHTLTGSRCKSFCSAQFTKNGGSLLRAASDWPFVGCEGLLELLERGDVAPKPEVPTKGSQASFFKNSLHS